MREGNTKEARKAVNAVLDKLGCWHTGTWSDVDRKDSNRLKVAYRLGRAPANLAEEIRKTLTAEGLYISFTVGGMNYDYLRFTAPRG